MYTKQIGTLRSTLVLLLAVIFVPYLQGCSGGDSPSEVAENFLKDLGKKDYNGAKSYSTDEGDRVIEMMKDLDEMMPDSARQETSYEVLSEKIEGNVATVQFKVSGSTEEPESLTLIKEEGKWQVSMTKESMNTPLLSDQPAEPAK
ncbi:MAG: hypothetical protein RL021_452 [Bacteroidota bacterium]|jgi:hypothetical protein